MPPQPLKRLKNIAEIAIAKLRYNSNINNNNKVAMSTYVVQDRA